MGSMGKDLPQGWVLPHLDGSRCGKTQPWA